VDAVPTTIQWKYGERILSIKERSNLAITNDKQNVISRSNLLLKDVKQGTFFTVTAALIIVIISYFTFQVIKVLTLAQVKVQNQPQSTYS